MTAKTDDEKYIAAKLEKAGRDAEIELLAALNMVDLFDFCYAIKSRTKSEEKLLEKVTLKKQEKGSEDYSLEKITDIVGLRFVTLFKLEKPLVFQKILEIYLG